MGQIQEGPPTMTLATIPERSPTPMGAPHVGSPSPEEKRRHTSYSTAPDLVSQARQSKSLST